MKFKTKSMACVVLAVIGALGVAPTFAETTEPSPKIETQDLRISFEQGSRDAFPPMLQSIDQTDGTKRYMIELAPEPFNMVINQALWSIDNEYPAVQIAVSDSEAVFDLIKWDQPANQTPFMMAGMAYAEADGGDTILRSLHTDGKLCCDGRHYKPKARLKFEEGRPQARVPVTSILHSDDQSELLSSGKSVYLIVYIDQEGITDWREPDPIRRQEVELIEIRFKDLTS